MRIRSISIIRTLSFSTSTLLIAAALVLYPFSEAAATTVAFLLNAPRESDFTGSWKLAILICVWEACARSILVTFYWHWARSEPRVLRRFWLSLISSLRSLIFLVIVSIESYFMAISLLKSIIISCVDLSLFVIEVSIELIFSF